MEQKANTPSAIMRKQRVGVVVSNKMDKTVVVAITRIIQHPLYKKSVKTTARFMAHSPNNDVFEGDEVRIEEIRPLSARKRWRVVEVLKRGEAAQIDAESAQEEAES